MDDSRPGRRLKPLSSKLGPEMAAWVTRLREFYTGLDMTYVELAEMLGGDPSTLSRYFNGQRLPEIGFSERLYRAVETKTHAPVQDQVKDSVRALLASPALLPL
ncbi:transcriptional regulator with XRE-family HTH domain [Streptomyces sp. V4I23]|uniref:helix-turn-helix domain-containing protein n=1 Tax=Streptomyces sp. V4I23 TaxID=3042282 RepID=UPI002786A9D2|nr:helix-turn-helix transcriptional regulator [Streptomyces sp. V4I23]MDQ1007289.1 transcriptional regulator with XRE-family HTH domain [Streptomyces sp. V4I23]